MKFAYRVSLQRGRGSGGSAGRREQRGDRCSRPATSGAGGRRPGSRGPAAVSSPCSPREAGGAGRRGGPGPAGGGARRDRDASPGLPARFLEAAGTRQRCGRGLAGDGPPSPPAVTQCRLPPRRRVVDTVATCWPGPRRFAPRPPAGPIPPRRVRRAGSSCLVGPSSVQGPRGCIPHPRCATLNLRLAPQSAAATEHSGFAAWGGRAKGTQSCWKTKVFAFIRDK